MASPYSKTWLVLLLLLSIILQSHRPTNYDQHNLDIDYANTQYAVATDTPFTDCPAVPQLASNGATGYTSSAPGGIACIGCTIVDAGNILNDNLTDHATILIPVGIAGFQQIGIRYPQTYPAGTRVGFVMDVNGGVAGLLNNVSLTSYLNGAVQETVPSTNLLNVLGIGGGSNVSAVFCEPFDEVRLTAGALVGAVATYRIFYAYANNGAQFPVQCGQDIERVEVCDDCIDNDGDGLLEYEDDGCTSIPTSCGTVPQNSDNGASLGDSGIDAPSILGISLCIGCSVSNESNLIDNNYNNFSTISFPLGVTGTGYLSVKLGRELPAGTRAGFVVDVDGGIAGLLNGMSLTAYRNGRRQQTISGGGLLSLLGIGGESRVGGVFCTSFDEIRLSVSSTVGVGKLTRVYYAYADEGAHFPVPCGFANPTAEICQDCIDNDGDGRIDGEQSGCGAPMLASPFAASASETITGTILDVDATDDVDSEGNGLTYSITNDPLNSPDGSLFNIDPNTGEVSFNTPPDYEQPLDSDGDNIYQFEVAVTDSNGLTSTTIFAVSVDNDCEVSVVNLSYK